jgi:hypothetical protein
MLRYQAFTRLHENLSHHPTFIGENGQGASH